MEVLGRIQARHISVLTFVVAQLTIWGCYLMAGSLGHVHWWLPMISDCAVQVPTVIARSCACSRDSCFCREKEIMGMAFRV